MSRPGLLFADEALIQRSICGHLTEEMTERYSSIAQGEVEAALGTVVSLAGYRELLLETAGDGCESGCERPRTKTSPARGSRK